MLRTIFDRVMHQFNLPKTYALITSIIHQDPHVHMCSVAFYTEWPVQESISSSYHNRLLEESIRHSCI